MVCTFVALTNSTEELLPSSRYIKSHGRNNNICIHRFEKLNSKIKRSCLGELSALRKAHFRYLPETSAYIVGIHDNEGETSVSSHQTARRHISGRCILTTTAVTQHLTTVVTERIFSKFRSGSLYKY